MRRGECRTDAAARRVLLLAITTATVAKVLLAATTVGVNDMQYWAEFAESIRGHGPIAVYGETHQMTYNHPPLAGWLLVLVVQAQDLGVPFGLGMRLPATLADAGTAWLLYRLLLERHSPRAAVLAAATVVWSPVLVIVSGYHGNTDPLFVALTLAAFYALTRLDRPVVAGLCLGAAISVKLVPVVCLPWLLVLAMRAGRPVLARFVLGGAMVFAVLWVPVLLTEWPDFRANVLGYGGVWLREWGIGEFLDLAGRSDAEEWLAGRGAAVPLLAAYFSLVGLVTRRQDQDQVGVGLALVVMLLLTTAFGMQYLAWALAASYLVSLRAAFAFNLFASVLVVSVYALWSGGGPVWTWEEGVSRAFTPTQLVLMILTWTALLGVAVAGLVGGRTRASVPRANAGTASGVLTPFVGAPSGVLEDTGTEKA